MKYWLFLDDERLPPHKWSLEGMPIVICRSYDEFVKAIYFHGLPQFMSLDHDLGEGRNGFFCSSFLIDWMLDHHYNDHINYVVHSANPVGKENIESLLDNWNEKGRF